MTLMTLDYKGLLNYQCNQNRLFWPPKTLQYWLGSTLLSPCFNPSSEKKSDVLWLLLQSLLRLSQGFVHLKGWFMGLLNVLYKLATMFCLEKSIKVFRHSWCDRCANLNNIYTFLAIFILLLLNLYMVSHFLLVILKMVWELSKHWLFNDFKCWTC